ncbi:sugar-transfer associated ATP-grasp domain-containing protein [Mariniflexile sp.]|uniref:sugar-transfer associated ATP-grasp domain-containing protein n=1 Tax=Mariniflexile sp. TaxID=1979402 RepID=UPI0035615587
MLKFKLYRIFLYFKHLAYYYKLTNQYRKEIIKKTRGNDKILNNRQISEIQLFYSKFGFNKINTLWHEFYYSSNKIYSVKYIPEDIFHAVISNRFNEMRQWPSLLDKNLLYELFRDYKQPDVVLRNINSFFYVGNKIVSKEDAIKRIASEQSQMIIKPSIESGNGSGIIVFSSNAGNISYNGLSIKDFLNSYKKDFIIQKLVHQHENLKKLNESSLNTLRVLSYLNQDGVNILSIILRIGKKGSFTDNCSTGGIACGLSDIGLLKKYGFLNDGTVRTATDNGCKLENTQVPSFELVKEQIKEMHLLIPYFRIVSWDIGIDTTGTPVLIEYNTYHQDITIHQLANGPLFGRFTEEILLHK